MATKEKTGINIGSGAFVSEREAVLVPSGDGADGGLITLYAHKLGCLQVTEIMGIASARDESWLIPMVAASIQDDDGNQFTIEEVRKLRKEVADPLFLAVLKANNLASGDGEEKK